MANLCNSKNVICESNKLDKREEQETLKDEEESFSYAMQVATSLTLPMALNSIIELGVFEVLQKAGKGAQLSAHDIVSHLPHINNSEAAKILDRILALLASHSVLHCSIITHLNSFQRHYSMTRVAKFFAPNSDGVSLGPFIALVNHKSLLSSWLVYLICESYSKTKEKILITIIYIYIHL